MYTPLTSQTIARRAMEWWRAENTDLRVEAYNVHGDRVGVVDVGEGVHRLTFPSHLKVEQVLGFDHWVKRAPPGSAKWYEHLDTWRPRVVVFKNNCIANPEDPIGMKGNAVTVLDTCVSRWVEERLDLPDLSGVLTPRTPSVASGAGSCGACQVFVLSCATSSDEEVD